MHTTTPASWEELPPELFLLCFGYLPVVDLAAGCSLVCSWWYAASQQDSLWEAHFHRYRRRWQESLEGAISPAFLLNWFFPVASSFSSSSADTCSQLPVLSGIRFPMLEALATGIKRSTTFKRSCSRFILSSFLQFHVPALRHNHINKHNHQTFFKSLAWKSRVKACFHQNGLLAEPFLRWSHESSSGYSSGFSVSSSTCSCFTLEDNLLAEVLSYLWPVERERIRVTSKKLMMVVDCLNSSWKLRRMQQLQWNKRKRRTLKMLWKREQEEQKRKLDDGEEEKDKEGRTEKKKRRMTKEEIRV
ncbi:hypothetical protein QOT17_004054 [Balamuthia mandrillaris]